jgi:glycine/D-amino acid oxidase-like deaminating enzyme
MSERWDNVVIGGGFFGLYLAEHLSKRGESVVVCERGSELMTRASYHNQARIHNGYHYPRSLLTAIRSHVNYPRFVAEFDDCIDDSFTHYYAIGRRFSKVSANQFLHFMQRVGSPMATAPAAVRKWFDPAYVEDVFRVQEGAFDAVKLKDAMRQRCDRAGVQFRLRADVRGIRQAPDSWLELELGGEGGGSAIRAGRAFACTYSQLNAVLQASNLPAIPLKHELAELALVDVPATLHNVGVTVMCGPFFSCMPFPPRKLHTLSHVRYTPHGEWQDNGTGPMSAYEVFERTPKQTSFPHMMRDAARYLPALRDCKYVDSLWEIKTVLPRSEVDDSRPILYKSHYGYRNFHVVMGAKIDNVYDVIDAVDATLLPTRASG